MKVTTWRVWYGQRHKSFDDRAAALDFARAEAVKGTTVNLVRYEVTSDVETELAWNVKE